MHSKRLRGIKALEQGCVVYIGTVQLSIMSQQNIRVAISILFPYLKSRALHSHI